MIHSVKPVKSTGFIQWNTGGWFGGCLGGVAWMIPMTIFLLNYHQYSLAAISAISCLLSIAISILLWKKRDSLSPMTAHLLILGIFSVEIPMLLSLVTLYGSADCLAAMNWPGSLSELVVASLVAPGLMVWFYVMNRYSQVGNESPLDDSPLIDPQNEV